jgi:chromosome segregation ATPase
MSFKDATEEIFLLKIEELEARIAELERSIEAGNEEIKWLDRKAIELDDDYQELKQTMRSCADELEKIGDAEDLEAEIGHYIQALFDIAKRLRGKK